MVLREPINILGHFLQLSEVQLGRATNKQLELLLLEHGCDDLFFTAPVKTTLEGADLVRARFGEDVVNVELNVLLLVLFGYIDLRTTFF